MPTLKCSYVPSSNDGLFEILSEKKEKRRNINENFNASVFVNDNQIQNQCQIQIHTKNGTINKISFLRRNEKEKYIFFI